MLSEEICDVRLIEVAFVVAINCSEGGMHRVVRLAFEITHENLNSPQHVDLSLDQCSETFLVAVGQRVKPTHSCVRPLLHNASELRVLAREHHLKEVVVRHLSVAI